MPTANPDPQPRQDAVPIPHRLAGWTLALVLGGLRVLPAWLSYLLADACAVPLVFASWWREKRVGRGVNRNLRIVYRDRLTRSMARRMRWAWARHMTWIAVDFSRMPSIDKTNLDRFVDVGALGRLPTAHLSAPEFHWQVLRSRLRGDVGFVEKAPFQAVPTCPYRRFELSRRRSDATSVISGC